MAIAGALLATTLAAVVPLASAESPVTDTKGEASVGARDTDRQTARLTFTSRRPGGPSGSGVDIQFRDPNDPAGKPHAVRRIVLRYAPGSAFDTSVPARCDASNAELMAQGAAACPPESRVASGTLLTDTGSAGGFPRFVRNEVTNFNNDGELITLAESANPRTRVVSRAPIRGSTITIDVPPVPGSPPPDPFTAFKRLRTFGAPIVEAGEAYARTPPSCPPSGHWTNRVTVTYRDGVTDTDTTRAPCRTAPSCRGLAATIEGTARGELLRGTRGRDVILAGAGEDVVRGGGGKDVACGGRGNDRLSGDRGGDLLFGGTGGDAVKGGRRPDRLRGGRGGDRLGGGRASDSCRGGRGRDRVRRCER